MAANSCSALYQCPSCHENFGTSHALMVHLNFCRISSKQNVTEPSQKRPLAQLTLAQHADEMLKVLMKRPHTSGHRINIDRLSVHPSIRAAVSTSSSHGIAFDGNTIHGDDDFQGTGYEFHNEYKNNNTSEETNNTSIDGYKFCTDLNPPPGVKFGVHLQHLISSHHGVDLKLYDEIIDLIKTHATTKEIDFETHKLYHRIELTNTLSIYNLDALKPILHNITLSDSSGICPCV